MAAGLASMGGTPVAEIDNKGFEVYLTIHILYRKMHLVGRAGPWKKILGGRFASVATR